MNSTPKRGEEPTDSGRVFPIRSPVRGVEVGLLDGAHLKLNADNRYGSAKKRDGIRNEKNESKK